MARLVTCTSCGQRLTLPEGLEESQLVCCPLCSAQFPLSDVSAEADDAAALPPELVPVQSSSEQSLRRVLPEAEAIVGPKPEADLGSSQVEPSDQMEAAEETETPREAEQPDAQIEQHADEAEQSPEDEQVRPDETEEPEEEPTFEKTEEPAFEKTEEPADEEEGRAAETEQPIELPEAPAAGTDEPTSATEAPSAGAEEAAAEEEIAQVRCPCCRAEYPLSEAIVVATGDPLGPVAAALVTNEGLARQEELSRAATSERAPVFDLWEKVDGVPHIDTGEGTQGPAVTVDAEAFDFAKTDSETADASAAAAALRPRRRPREKSLIRELASWVFGGVAGLLIAYYALNWIRGEQGNFLKIPLPGVPHTYKHSPDWFPGWLKAAPDSEDSSPDETRQ